MTPVYQYRIPKNQCLGKKLMPMKERETQTQKNLNLGTLAKGNEIQRKKKNKFQPKRRPSILTPECAGQKRTATMRKRKPILKIGLNSYNRKRVTVRKQSALLKKKYFQLLARNGRIRPYKTV